MECDRHNFFYFLLFLPPLTTQKIKIKKGPGDIIILHNCIINNNDKIKRKVLFVSKIQCEQMIYLILPLNRNKIEINATIIASQNYNTQYVDINMNTIII